LGASVPSTNLPGAPAKPIICCKAQMQKAGIVNKLHSYQSCANMEETQEHTDNKTVLTPSQAPKRKWKMGHQHIGWIYKGACSSTARMVAPTTTFVSHTVAAHTARSLDLSRELEDKSYSADSDKTDTKNDSEVDHEMGMEYIINTNTILAFHETHALSSMIFYH
jgi:hypothetical protein